MRGVRRGSLSFSTRPSGSAAKRPPRRSVAAQISQPWSSATFHSDVPAQRGRGAGLRTRGKRRASRPSASHESLGSGSYLSARALELLRRLTGDMRPAVLGEQELESLHSVNGPGPSSTDRPEWSRANHPPPRASDTPRSCDWFRSDGTLASPQWRDEAHRLSLEEGPRSHPSTRCDAHQR